MVAKAANRAAAYLRFQPLCKKTACDSKLFVVFHWGLEEKSTLLNTHMVNGHEELLSGLPLLGLVQFFSGLYI